MSKKLFIPITCFILIFNSSALAQWSIGIKFNPGYNISRVESSTDSLSINGTYNGLRFVGGLVFMNEFNDNYHFVTGINFSPKKTGVKASGPNSIFDEEINIQYLQLPASIKLFTNEVGLDKRIYFQIGGNLEVNIHDTLDEIENLLIQKTSLIDLSLMLSSGMDIKIGEETHLNLGASYSRGLLNQFSDTGSVDVRNVIDFLSIDLGIKF